MSDTREEITLEEMPEVRLRGGQVVTWAVVVMVMVLLSFFFGYYSGRSAERQRRSVKGDTVSKLLRRLEVYSEENRRMIAKQRLTAQNRTAVNVRELPEGQSPVAARVQVIRGHGGKEHGTLAVSRKSSRGKVIKLSRSRRPRTAGRPRARVRHSSSRSAARASARARRRNLYPKSRTTRRTVAHR